MIEIISAFARWLHLNANLILYGRLFNFKLIVLAIILIIAFQARYKWLPLLSQADNKRQTKETEISTAHLSKWVSIEFLLVLVLLMIASILANTLPAKHAVIENWPHPFRFSIDATWEEPYVTETFSSGANMPRHCQQNPLIC